MEQRLNSVCLYVISDTRRDINYTLTKESYDLSYFIFFPLIFFHPFLTSILLLLRFPVLSRINAMQHLVPTIYQLYPDLRLIPLEKHVVDFYLILVVYGMVVFLLQNMSDSVLPQSVGPCISKHCLALLSHPGYSWAFKFYMFSGINITWMGTYGYNNLTCKTPVSMMICKNFCR